MGEVKRYDVADPEAMATDGMVECAGGHYVLHSDYATIEAERDALREQLAKLADEGTGYSQQTVNAISGERDALRAEVAKLRAACAAKDAALRIAKYSIGYESRNHAEQMRLMDARDAIHRALSTDAVKGWIDASGAVEATVKRRRVGGMDDHAKVETFVPAEWAGDTVKIVRVAK